MLNNGPLVGDAEAETPAQAFDELEGALRGALGGKYTDQHSLAVRRMGADYAAGVKSWRLPGVWVTLEA